MKHKTCTVDGCGKKHRAGGLCSTHYNQQRYTASERHPVVTVACGWCGRDCVKGETAKFAERFCSLRCRDDWRVWRSGQTDTLLPLDRRSCLIPARHPARHPIRPPRTWVGGNCARCGSMFLAEDYTNRARYCTDRCRERDGHVRRRAAKRGAFVANVNRRDIMVRDDWTCHLCGLAVDRDQLAPHPLAPVLDHVIPLARGGTHEPSNVKCAHFICNSIKGDRDVGTSLVFSQAV